MTNVTKNQLLNEKFIKESEAEQKDLESSLQASINFFESQIDHIQEVIYLNKKENV